MDKVIRTLYYNSILERLFHTLVYCLKKELNDCESVLDLGCGPSSPLQFCNKIKHSLGVEIFTPYLRESQKKKVHNQYLNQDIMNIKIAPGSFDAVIMIEVLEHLSEKDGLTLLERAEKWAKKKIIISSPNGFIPQKEVDNNPLQKHLSGWDNKKMKKLGFKSRGLAGLKFLRQEVQSDTMGNDLTTSIRFKPKFFWFIIATFSQIITYFFPKYAFELFSVKIKNDKKV